MNETAIVVAAIAAIIELGFFALAIFCIGFFVGFKREEKKLFNKTLLRAEKADKNTKEEKERKEWKKFLSYDGSADTDKNSF